ncbi:MAG TPA: PP2C family protein-serine/threonine phosphatase [Candidatus Sulfotelmatobacter sp.]|jgi:serine phosphatase RsbU (regulator of sigma subunit)|nr:PP2C family protein-serine/threonine phosphatase [Candidatus Sulfotelmatobacter sp.]
MRSLFRSRTPVPAPAAEPVPTVFPKIEGADIAAVFAGKRVAGDFYDSVRVSPERVLFGLLDVAGRRDDNRGILIAAQDIFRNFGAKLFSGSDINEADAMTELCLRINRGLIDSSKGVRSCPAFLACFHEKFGTLCYTNAGHTPGLLRDSRGIAELASTGLPLGLFSHATSDAPTVGLEKGAALLLISRGVIECGGHHDKSDEEFGLARVKPVLQTAPATSAQALCSAVLNTVGDFTGHAPLCDDRTALALIRMA